jgi:hypothetical protein
MKMLNIHKLHPQYLTNEAGKKTAVVLSIEKFEELLEDFGDLATVLERRNEATISHDGLIKKLKKNGLL